MASLEEEALAESVGLALLVVLETLAPAERLAFVLHDMFGVSFDRIATIVDRTPAAARQLASRARRRVQGAPPGPDTDLDRQREVVDAFIAASRNGDFDAVVAVLDPDVVLRAERGGARIVTRGARTVAGQALAVKDRALIVRHALVNGSAGLVSWLQGGQRFSVMRFTVANGIITGIDVLTDRARLDQLELGDLGG